MSHDPFKWRADEIRKAVELMEAMMAAERVKVERLTTAADGAKGLRPVKPYPSQTQHWNHSRYYTPEAARAALAKLIEEDTKVKAENSEAAAHNDRVIKAAVDFCKGLGLPDTQRYVKGRERDAKMHTARWLAGLLEIAPPAPAWPSYNHEQRARGIDEWERKLNNEKAAKEYAKRAEEHRLANERERIAAELRREMQPSPQQALQERLREQVAAPAVMPEGSLSLAEALEIE